MPGKPSDVGSDTPGLAGCVPLPPKADASDSKTATRTGWPSPYTLFARARAGLSPGLLEDGEPGGDEIGQFNHDRLLAVVEVVDGSVIGVDRPHLQCGWPPG